MNKITEGLGAVLPSRRGRQPATKLLLVTFTVFSLLVPPAQAQWAVFDASNFAENMLTAARALEQVNNQIQSLQNEAVMLENMARNLQSLDVNSLGRMTAALSQINGLMTQGNGIAFTVSATNTAFAQQFPSSYGSTLTTSQALSDARIRWQSAMSAYSQTMQIQAQVDQNVQADAGTLSDLVTASQGAVGSLQAQQAGNQLIALSAKQQMQIQTLMAAQYRAEALDQARKAQSEAAAQAMTTQFLGSGTAYTPQ
jgi:P-type conjugative transfer protein TrbJ